MARKAEKSTPVYLEVGSKRVFACSLEWPGWCRSGKTEVEALAALAVYAPRYAPAAEEAGLNFSPGEAPAFEVVERLPGTGTTDFGAPACVAGSDTEPLKSAEAKRLATLVAAAWTVLDRVVAGTPAELRKGPRGGGRDRDKMVAHVLAAEAAYARTIGVRQREPSREDPAAVAALHEAILRAINAAAGQPQRVKTGWPVRYAARRIAWHALDHAWEMEDRSEALQGKPDGAGAR